MKDIELSNHAHGSKQRAILQPNENHEETMKNEDTGHKVKSQQNGLINHGRPVYSEASSSSGIPPPYPLPLSLLKKLVKDAKVG